MAKDIFDKEFKDKLQHAEVMPPADAWDNIASQLEEEKPAFAWKSALAVVALAVLFLSVGFFIGSYFSNNEIEGKVATEQHTVKDKQKEVLSTDSKDISSDKNGVNLNDANPVVTNDQQPIGTMDNNASYINSSEDEMKAGNSYQTERFSNPQTILYDNATGVSERMNTNQTFASNDGTNEISTPEYNGATSSIFQTENNNAFQEDQTANSTRIEHSDVYLADNTGNVYSMTSVKNDLDKMPLFPAPLTTQQKRKLAELRLADEKAEKKKARELKWENAEDNRFFISSFVSPTMLGSFKEDNLLSERFSDLRTENQATTAYGAKVGYAVNDKMKLRSGVGVVSLEQHTYGASLSLTPYATNQQDLNINTKSEISIGVNTSELPGNDLNGENVTMDIAQEISFIEVPFEIEYEIMESGKLEVNVSSGLSTLIMRDNTIYLNNDSGTVLGEASNINPISFSANAGVKFDLKLNPNVSLNVEPQLKYLFNSFDNNRNIAPYVLGVQGGLSYSF